MLGVGVGVGGVGGVGVVVESSNALIYIMVGAHVRSPPSQNSNIRSNNCKNSAITARES